MTGQGRYLLTVCNFSRTPVRERITLGNLPGTGNIYTRIISLGTHNANYVLENSTLLIDLGAWEGKAFFLGDPATHP
jgi:hypothetical protein